MGLAEAQSGGDPMGRSKWVRVSLRHLNAALARLGHVACPNTVRRLLREAKYSLKASVRRLSGPPDKPPHPDRDRQFRYIGRRRAAFRRLGLPVVSLDGKKKELVGDAPPFKNAGRAWRRRAPAVGMYDFAKDADCRAVPYGLYDVARDRGHVVVGTGGDTGAFAADCLGHWWRSEGRAAYPGARRVLVLADGGGSNGCRPRLWKLSLQAVADRHGLEITVCHYPTGASKWNPVEHRLFGPISTNWAGSPLRSLAVVLAFIRGTTTGAGLKVTAFLSRRKYPTGVKVSDEQMASLNLRRHRTCPSWNYTVKPRPTTPADPGKQTRRRS